MRVLFIITARGGSKGIPGKNIRELNGLPLLAYKIISAQRCKYENRIVVSTDDKNIAKTALNYGAEVPFIRPPELATDTASSMDVVEHALKWVLNEEADSYEYICLLEPSSPFATYEDLNKAIDILISSGSDTVLGMKEVEVCREFIHELDKNGGLSLFYEAIQNMPGVRRQDQPHQYTMNGCMYLAKTEYFLKHKTFHSANSRPYIMPWERSIEIDSIQDLHVAEFIIENKLIDNSYWK